MLDKLFSPITINGKTIKNRFVVPAMVMNFCNEDGTCTERFTAYHEGKAKGGFGMIITEDMAVAPLGKGAPCLPGLWNDGQIEGFKEFTERIHKYDTVIIAQIYHAGRQTSKELIGEEPWAPSAIPCPLNSGSVPHEMTIDEIKETVSCFGDSALRAKKAGFDGIEIHGAHGYLVAQFLSPYSNKRTDRYGGPLQNRMRFALEIIGDIKRKCGEDFIIGFRISSDEYVTGGRNIEDTKTIVPYLEQAGISYIHVTAGVYRSSDYIIPPMYFPHAWNADAAAEVKKITKLPVISVGRYNDVRIAEAVLDSGKADMVAFGRQSLTDPETPNKAKAGCFDDIRMCIGCNHGCVGNLSRNIPGTCILNPTLGLEYQQKEIKKSVPKKVMVIGAGPAGLQAAISAAECGHNVAVYEKKRWAGGQFRLASVPAGKGEIAAFISWQMHKLEKLGVQVFFHTEVDKEMVQRENPDVIVVATGAKPAVPPIKGINADHVVTSHDVLEGNVNTGNNIVVIGGGCVGAETANHLASNLKNVTLVEMMGDIAVDEELAPRWKLMEELQKNHVRICTETTVKEIHDGSVLLAGKVNEEIPADTVVVSVGSRPENALANELTECGCEVKVIGDASKVGLAGKAIREGYEIGRSL